MVTFCPKCGSLMMPKKAGKSVILACSCGYKDKEGKTELKETIIVSKDEREIEIVESDADLKLLPKTKEECPECGHREAYFWTLQTRAGDEPETKFMKCCECKHTWRDYG